MHTDFEVFDKNLNKTFLVSIITGNGVSFVDELKKEKVITHDTETTYAKGFELDKQAGLDPYRSRLRLIQFGLPDDKVFLFDNFHIDEPTRNAIKELLEAEYPVKAIFNAKFDIKMARHHLGVTHYGKVFCGEIAYRISQCGQYKFRQSLMKVVQDLLGFTIEKEMQLSDWSGELNQTQLEYAARDVFVLFPVREKIIEIIKDLRLQKALKIALDVIDPTATMELNGFFLNREKWIDVDLRMRNRYFDVLDEIVEAFRENGAIPQKGLFAGAPAGSKRSHYSVTSAKQIAEFLEHSGITLPTMKEKKTKKVHKTTNSVWLKPLKNTHKVLPMLLEFRELNKRKTSYGADYPDMYCHPVTGRIHSDYDSEGTKTGRYANTKPNLQQIPALDIYLACFEAGEGRCLVGGDYSQIELRLAAEFSGERGYIDAFLSGKDFHSETTKKIFGIDESDPDFDKLRTAAKRINFGIIYGIGEEKLSLQTGMSVAECAQHLTSYRNTFQTLDSYLETSGRTCAWNQQSVVWTGRIVRFWVTRGDRGSISQAERNGKNTPIQGGAGEILKIALRYAHDAIWKSGKDIKLVHTVHDAIILDCKNEDIEFTKELLRDCMVRAGEQILKKVPCKVDLVWLPYWAKHMPKESTPLLSEVESVVLT